MILLTRVKSNSDDVILNRHNMSSSDETTCVYLDIEIGDQTLAREQELGYKLIQDFYQAVAQQYGWTSQQAACDLDNESQEILLEAFNSDPQWSSKSDAIPRIHPPDALQKGRLEIELFYEAAPKACENFRCLCTGEKGNGKTSRKPLHYKNTKFHRIVKGFMAQGGDIVKNDGSSGDSIYNGAFKDEKTGLKLRHDSIGTVAYANSGPHTQKSQFYITFGPAPQCDGKHVVIGRVQNQDGLAFLKRMEEIAAADKDGESPRDDVIIADCGELKA